MRYEVKKGRKIHSKTNDHDKLFSSLRTQCILSNHSNDYRNQPDYSCFQKIESELAIYF
jgi:hypothetical protein